jgi:adenosylcobinamide-GDP ribazoletransferase
MTEALRLTAVAFQFLTRLPVPQIRVDDGDLRRASAAFPLVGVVVGAVGVAVRAGAEVLWGPGPATIAAVLAMVAVTGAFHEDGLADSADGLWGGWTPEQRVAIMRDSRLGTYGAVALVAVLALRVALLLALPLAAFAAAVIAGAVLGRASTLLLVRLLPAAPAAAGGSGASVVGPLGRGGTLVAATTVAAVLAGAARLWAPFLLGAGLVVVAACRRLLRRRLGGVTGDGLGASNQLVELAVIAAVAALVGAGLW